ncbi:beta-1 adrenergic receptor [Plakobranchus ocellatus]|uniref:Beta-1 adrenergic receptor n=1 Tax=Plakobranchus ocellatus TaxID=259542 RepID=A0AAV4BJI3_9GAST|nr:beta-1 adrenergic receptor [Plakobranchus ocellatus]
MPASNSKHLRLQQQQHSQQQNHQLVVVLTSTTIMSHVTTATQTATDTFTHDNYLSDATKGDFSSISTASSLLNNSRLTTAVITIPPPLPEAVRIFLCLTAVCISVSAVICNTLLVLAIVKSRALQTPTNLFLSSLSAGETIFAVFAVPLAAASVLAGKWPFSQSACHVSGALQSIGRSSSTFSLMAVCLDRCLAVSRPLKYSHLLTLRTGSLFLTVLWILAIIMAVLPINRTWGRYAYDNAHFMCILTSDPDDARQNLVQETVCSFIPAVVIVISLLQIVREVRSHHRIFSVVPLPVAATTSSAVGDTGGVARELGDTGGGIPGLVVPLGLRSFNRNTLKAMRCLFFVTLGYALFCLPADFVNALYNPSRDNTSNGLSGKVWDQEEDDMEGGYEDGEGLEADAGPSSPQVETMKHHITAIVWLSFVCCVLNPVIIIVFNRKFRTELMAIFSCYKLVRKLRPNKEVFTISTGLHSILEATLVLNMVKKEQASTTTSTRRQILGPAQAQ